MRYGAASGLPSLTTEVPTLMVWGKKDAYLEFGMAEKSANYCKNFTLCTIDAAGHWVQQEAPKQTNKYVREFLSGKKFE